MKKLLQSRKAKLVTCGILMVALAIGGTYAWFTASIEKQQVVSMGSLRIEAVFDEIDDPINYEPGLTVDFDGTIKNTGTISTIIGIDTKSQVKLKYRNDDFTPIAKPIYTDDHEKVSLVTFQPQSGDYTDPAGEVFWYGDPVVVGKRYVSLAPGASIVIALETAFDGEKMGNKYQESDFLIGAVLKATQEIEGAILSELGIDAATLVPLDGPISRNASRMSRASEDSPAALHLQEIIAKSK